MFWKILCNQQTQLFLKKKTQFCSKKLHNNVCLKYAVFQRMLNISHVQHTQFCAINKHYNSKKLHNNVCLKYTIFWRMLNLSHVQHTQFFKNKIARSTNTDSNKLYNFVSANYAVFRITLKISHFLHTHNFPKKKKNCAFIKHTLRIYIILYV